MPFISEILKRRSVAVVGMAKNCGKTECLNYILRRLPVRERKVCVTSIGIDGETTDQVTRTAKPEIVLREGMFFSTSERHYRERQLTSEIIGISDESTALGRIITAKAVSEGTVILSGPSSTASLKRWMDETERFGIGLTVVDGALSRLSSASPAVTEALVLATGAAYSSNPAALITGTSFVVEMTALPLAENMPADDGAVFSMSGVSRAGSLPESCRRIRISGALTDLFMKSIVSSGQVKNLEICVKDFTRVFLTPSVYRTFVRAGGRLTVERRSSLLAVCLNPLAPNGYRLDSDRMCRQLSDRIGIPVYDIVKNRYET